MLYQIRTYSGFRYGNGKEETSRFGKLLGASGRYSPFALHFSPERDKSTAQTKAVKASGPSRQSQTLIKKAKRKKRNAKPYHYWLADDLPSAARADSAAVTSPCSISRPLWAEAPSRRPWKFMAERIATRDSGVRCQVCPLSLLSNTPWAWSAVASRRRPAASYCTASTSFLGSPLKT